MCSDLEYLLCIFVSGIRHPEDPLARSREEAQKSIEIMHNGAMQTVCFRLPSLATIAVAPCDFQDGYRLSRKCVAAF